MHTHDSELEACHGYAGDPSSLNSRDLDLGAGIMQEFDPVQNICAYLNVFHVYADDPTRVVEAHHYCSRINDDIRQCLIYDSNAVNARLIGIEYMISPKLYETLEPSERRLWHSHVFEVKSGILIMPKPSLIPEAVWELIAETREMEEIIQLYGKTYHTWQVDLGDEVPLGAPKLMASMSCSGSNSAPGFWERVAERDKRLVSDYMRKKEARKNMLAPDIHPGR
ncbi:DUF1264-domain-containing protein [Pholiota conissans]|uniref:DUF1264-domain-containing protein n=1 Tax=Pholiota conissans TaxID=109636 RepID=A0A9P5Z3I1_9AGAR|nr:DUF1264-domain-containing protein [Pholiota conissans]